MTARRLITDQNWQQVTKGCGVLPRFLQYGSPAAVACRLHPVGEQPDKLVPKDQWKERILEAHAKKMFPIYHFEKAQVKKKDQGWTNWCWAYGLASSLEAVRLLEGQPYRRLAPATLGWLVNWKNQGHWLSEAIAGAAQRGIASSEFADDTITNPRLFKPGWEQDALRHKPLEWFDTVGMDNRRRNEEEQVHQCVSLLLTPSPLYVAYWWWSHALMLGALEWDEREKHNLRWVALNSHNDGWIELSGSRGVPDESYAPRSSTFSPDLTDVSPGRQAC